MPHEGSKNVSLIQIRNLEGQNQPGHIVMSLKVSLERFPYLHYASNHKTMLLRLIINEIKRCKQSQTFQSNTQPDNFFDKKYVDNTYIVVM